MALSDDASIAQDVLMTTTGDSMRKRLVGASVWEEDLYEHLISHVEQERELLAEYQQAAVTSQSPAFEYLAALIIEDERRHHKLFADLASALKTDAELRPERPAVPRLDHWGSDPTRIRELTTQFLDREHADADELRRLGRQLKGLGDTPLWQLLVRMMQMDTKKHIAILEFVNRHLPKDR